MKIRNGFVSNSSSSSFIILTSRKNHEKAISEFNKKEQKIINLIMCNKSVLFGKEILYGEDISCEYYHTCSDIADRLNIEDEYEVADIWDKYVRIIEKNKDETFSYQVDM